MFPQYLKHLLESIRLGIRVFLSLRLTGCPIWNFVERETQNFKTFRTRRPWSAKNTLVNGRKKYPWSNTPKNLRFRFLHMGFWNVREIMCSLMGIKAWQFSEISDFFMIYPDFKTRPGPARNNIKSEFRLELSVLFKISWQNRLSPIPNVTDLKSSDVVKCKKFFNIRIL